MRKDKLGDVGRPYRLAHQTLCITGFNFETESLIGYVEMLLHPLKPDLKRIKINSKQARIYRVAINEIWEAVFNYNDPTLEICQNDAKQRNLDYFQGSHRSAMTSVDADLGNGELTIKLPPEAMPVIQDMKPIRICVEFSLEHPEGGIKFVVPDIDGTMLDRGAHLFTYGHENSSRLWFPCIDSYSEVCTWKLEFTVDMYMTAVSCGDLIETVYTPDLRKKTYHYYLSTPTAAPNLALAVGPFEVLVDPHMHEVTHFCLPHLLPLLKQSTAFLHEAFEFYEELLSSRYPYSCYKQVFVDQAYEVASPYATMTIFSTNVLHTKKIIDQVPESRQVMAQAIAQQFFGCFISMNSWYDAWLPKGITAYLGCLFKRKAFGNNDYRWHAAQELKAVQDYEQDHGGIILDPSMAKDSFVFPTKHPHTVSPKYYDIYKKKAYLTIRMLEIRIGRELLLQVLNKLLALATTASQQKFSSYNWYNMLLSSSSFLKCISTVTGKDMHTFIEQWVHQGGFARFLVTFVFNRKRNVVELELKQDWNFKGAMRYVGPLTVAIQELDGMFNHSFKIEENKTKFEITCHSKSRRHKKKKIPLSTGEEVDMDLNDTDSDSPVLWLRVDPELTVMRQVKMEQPDWMWQYLLRYERCVISQCDAIAALEAYPTPKTRLALTDTIENEACFYRVRLEAAHCLTKVANAMVNSWAGPPAMMTIYRKMFGSHSCPAIVRQNNFNNFQHYHLKKTLPSAMAGLRTVHSLCPTEVLHFMLDLFKYNDNSKNKYADNYYRAALVDSLAETVTPAVNVVTITGQGPSTDALTEDTKLILEEFTRYLNLEKLLPCYKLVVTVSCLKAIRKLQKFGHLPADATIFKSYAVQGIFEDVRLAALEALVDFTKAEGSGEILTWLLDIVEDDPEPCVRHSLFRMLVDCPPFTRKDDSPLSTEVLVERIYKMMNGKFAHDARLRCDAADLYHALFGRNRPACLPIPETVMVLNIKEKKTTLHHSMMETEDASDREEDMEEEEGPSHGIKRRADSPLSPLSPRDYLNTIQAADNITAVHTSDEGSQFKFKIRFGSKSPEAAASASAEPGEVQLSPPSSPPISFSPPPPAAQPQRIASDVGAGPAAAFTQEFLNFAGLSQPPVKVEPPSVVPALLMKPHMTVMSETVSETTMSRRSPTHPLSEESNSPPPTLPTETEFMETTVSTEPVPQAVIDFPETVSVDFSESSQGADGSPFAVPSSSLPQHSLTAFLKPLPGEEGSLLGTQPQHSLTSFLKPLHGEELPLPGTPSSLSQPSLITLLKPLHEEESSLQSTHSHLAAQSSLTSLLRPMHAEESSLQGPHSPMAAQPGLTALLKPLHEEEVPLPSTHSPLAAQPGLTALLRSVPTDLASSSEPGTGSKHHKAKKKKKNKKHKHKHKHKHEREDRERETSRERDRLAVGPGDLHDRPVGLGIILDHPSSGPSNTNSPAMRSMSSSPDFEVM